MGGEGVTGVLKMKSIWETGELAALPCQQPRGFISFLSLAEASPGICCTYVPCIPVALL